MSALTRLIPPRAKRAIKPLYLGCKAHAVRWLRPYGPEDLARALRRLGVASGDTLLVHGGFRRFNGFTAGPDAVIDTLRDVLGPDGNLLMVSMPYRGSSERYADAAPVFEVARTPSSMGLVSELFRRRAGVVRSASPLHPVLAAGPLAEWLVADHERLACSCGPGSPFERLLSLDGAVLFFDAPFASLTFMHYVEHAYRDRLPVALYDEHPRVVDVVDAAGRRAPVRQRVFGVEARARRRFDVMERELRAAGTLGEARVGNTRLMRVATRDVMDAAARLFTRGAGFYAA